MATSNKEKAILKWSDRNGEILEKIEDCKGSDRYAIMNMENGNIGSAAKGAHFRQQAVSFGNCKTIKEIERNIRQFFDNIEEYETELAATNYKDYL